MVLFRRGAVRLLDSLLCAPQQPIEEILGEEEAIRSVVGVAVFTNVAHKRRLPVINTLIVLYEVWLM